MKLIVGLGNPGTKYQKNRHNLGFMVVDQYLSDRGLTWENSQDLMGFIALGEGLVILKPATYVNRSGYSVRVVRNQFKIAHKDILIVHDDLDLLFGKIRLVFNSSSAGHRGIESVIKSLGSVDFARLRVGIGHPSRKATDGKHVDPERYVLEKFSGPERKQLPSLIKRCLEACETFVESGIEATMNRFN